MRIAGIALVLVVCLSGCAKHGPSVPVDAGYPGPATRPSITEKEKIDTAIARGVEFLVKSQQADGSWGTGTVTNGFEVFSLVPGTMDAMRVGTTGLCVMALREAGEKDAHAKGVEYLINHGEARRDLPDLLYNIWAQIFGLQALAEEYRTNKDPRIKKAALWQLDMLERYETYVGGWNYYDFSIGTQKPAGEPVSFGTAAGLVALYEARDAGIEVPQGLIDRALRRLAECRLPNGAYLYGSGYRYIPRLQANMLRGSIGRMQPCNYALMLWKDPKVNSEQALEGMRMFRDEHDYIQMGRKRPVPHNSWYQTAGYYYYYDHYYAARLMKMLGEPASAYRETILNGVLAYQEPDDGSWWDFPMWDYHKPYGTAFAVMTLLRCR
jgi:hypothetical protein